MLYLIAILTPPIYYLTQKKWIAVAVTCTLFLLGFAFFPIIPFLWLLCSICAVWDLRKVLMREHAKELAKEMARTMQGQPPAAGN